jgi:hypothetical protein
VLALSPQVQRSHVWKPAANKLGSTKQRQCLCRTGCPGVDRVWMMQVTAADCNRDTAISLRLRTFLGQGSSQAQQRAFSLVDEAGVPASVAKQHTTPPLSTASDTISPLPPAQLPCSASACARLGTLSFAYVRWSSGDRGSDRTSSLSAASLRTLRWKVYGYGTRRRSS